MQDITLASTSPRVWRRSSDLTQVQAAELAGVGGRNRALWSYWERGEREPPQDVVARIEAESGGAVTDASWAQVRESFLARKREQAEAQAQDAAIARMRDIGRLAPRLMAARAGPAAAPPPYAMAAE